MCFLKFRQMSDSRPPIDKSMLRDSIVDWRTIKVSCNMMSARTCLWNKIELMSIVRYVKNNLSFFFKLVYEYYVKGHYD